MFRKNNQLTKVSQVNQANQVDQASPADQEGPVDQALLHPIRRLKHQRNLLNLAEIVQLAEEVAHLLHHKPVQVIKVLVAKMQVEIKFILTNILRNRQNYKLLQYFRN